MFPDARTESLASGARHPIDQPAFLAARILVDTENFAFHAPDGFDTDYAGLTAYFQSLRAAFDDRTIRRGIIIAEGQHIACQTWIEGTFVHPFTQSPAGRLEPTGARVVMDLMNIFRFDDEGRLVEEYVRTDYRSFLRQLGAEGA